MLYLMDDGSIRGLHETFPGQVGYLFSPGAWRPPRGVPYALDNGRFSVWSKGKEWDEGKYYTLLGKAQKAEKPRWVLIPDVVADKEKTYGEWAKWTRLLSGYGFEFALAVQDGMTPEGVRGLKPGPDVVFVGGTYSWKWRTVGSWASSFPRVHVGRVNSIDALWQCFRLGIESVDGTGVLKREPRRRNKFINFLERTRAKLGPPRIGFFH